MSRPDIVGWAVPRISAAILLEGSQSLEGCGSFPNWLREALGSNDEWEGIGGKKAANRSKIEFEPGAEAQFAAAIDS